MLFFEILSIRWLLQASGWCGLVAWGEKEKTVVVKTPISHLKSSSQKSGKLALFEKPQVLQEHMWNVRISALRNLGIVCHNFYVEIYWGTESSKLHNASSIPWYTGHYLLIEAVWFKLRKEKHNKGSFALKICTPLSAYTPPANWENTLNIAGSSNITASFATLTHLIALKCIENT